MASRSSDSRDGVAPEVERHAPLVRLHPDETYGPIHAGTWLEKSKLFWHEAGNSELVADPALDLFAGGRGSAFRGHGLTDLTRPWESARPSGDPLDRGFALSAQVEPEPSPGVLRPVPVYYEHVRGSYVTYWLFYPWSTVPRKIPGARHGFEAFEVEDPSAADEAAAALLDAYPGLVRSASPPAGLEALPSPRAVIAFVQDWIGARWPVLHEGDWEGLAVSLRAGERRAAYFQHGRPQELPLGDHGRPEVWVALGSHASYPDIDPASAGSPRIKRFERLAESAPVEIELIDVRAQPWYGFGGAWGAPGRISDETGPLGPGEAKGPRPFAALSP